MNLAKWQHPTTGEVRIYCNQVARQGGAKIFIKHVEKDAFGYTYDIVVVADRGATTCSKADLQNYVEQNLTEMNGGKRPVIFEEIVELV